MDDRCSVWRAGEVIEDGAIGPLLAVALVRRRLCHMPKSSAISATEKPRWRECLIKRMAWMSASLYCR
jgi:hypothetical protein